MLWLRKLFARVTTPFYDSKYSGCQCCGICWYFMLVNPFWKKYLGGEHTTPFGDGHGCFPLCESCWQDLGTPEARLPFYEKLFSEWFHQCDSALSLAFRLKGGLTTADVETHYSRIQKLNQDEALIRAAVAAGK